MPQYGQAYQGRRARQMLKHSRNKLLMTCLKCKRDDSTFHSCLPEYEFTTQDNIHLFYDIFVQHFFTQEKTFTLYDTAGGRHLITMEPHENSQFHERHFTDFRLRKFGTKRLLQKADGSYKFAKKDNPGFFTTSQDGIEDFVTPDLKLYIGVWLQPVKGPKMFIPYQRIADKAVTMKTFQEMMVRYLGRFTADEDPASSSSALGTPDEHTQQMDGSAMAPRNLFPSVAVSDDPFEMPFSVRELFDRFMRERVQMISGRQYLEGPALASPEAVVARQLKPPPGRLRSPHRYVTRSGSKYPSPVWHRDRSKDSPATAEGFLLAALNGIYPIGSLAKSIPEIVCFVVQQYLRRHAGGNIYYVVHTFLEQKPPAVCKWRCARPTGTSQITRAFAQQATPYLNDLYYIGPTCYGYWQSEDEVRAFDTRVVRQITSKVFSEVVEAFARHQRRFPARSWESFCVLVFCHPQICRKLAVSSGEATNLEKLRQWNAWEEGLLDDCLDQLIQQQRYSGRTFPIGYLVYQYWALFVKRYDGDAANMEEKLKNYKRTRPNKLFQDKVEQSPLLKTRWEQVRYTWQ